MTNATDRAAIVDALKTVAELAVYPTMPDTPTANAAWPAWSSSAPLNWCANRSEWFVFVIVPNGNAGSTVDAADTVMEDVVAALVTIGKVTRWEPWRMPMEAGQQTVPVVRFTMEMT
jgi:hypothetical protein